METVAGRRWRVHAWMDLAPPPALPVDPALASQVGSFGTIIRGVKVYGTPTVMIINRHGQAKTLTGYTDAYAIEQAISETRRVK